MSYKVNIIIMIGCLIRRSEWTKWSVISSLLYYQRSHRSCRIVDMTLITAMRFTIILHIMYSRTHRYIYREL